MHIGTCPRAYSKSFHRRAVMASFFAFALFTVVLLVNIYNSAADSKGPKVTDKVFYILKRIVFFSVFYLTAYTFYCLGHLRLQFLALHNFDFSMTAIQIFIYTIIKVKKYLKGFL